MQLMQNKRYGSRQVITPVEGGGKHKRVKDTLVEWVRYIFISLIMHMFCSCNLFFNNKNIKNEQTDRIDYCAMLDSIKNGYFIERSNKQLNDIIPILVTNSNINSNADKGTIGYWYTSDSIFMKDYNAWKKYYGCK